jgi:small subunit ribosomal protein S16
MSVRVRLTRVGSKKNPIWRVVVTDQRSPRDGRFIETIGRYNPQTNPSTIAIDEDRLEHWIARGAQPSGAVKQLMKAQAKSGGPQAADGHPEEGAAETAAAAAAEPQLAAAESETGAAQPDAGPAEPEPGAAAPEAGGASPEPEAGEREAGAAEPEPGTAEPEPAATAPADESEGEPSPRPTDS